MSNTGPQGVSMQIHSQCILSSMKWGALQRWEAVIDQLF